MVSTFLKLEGNTVRNRILNFLVVHSEFDYSMRDIARFSDVSYTALKSIWKEYIRRKMVIYTRCIGNAKMCIGNAKMYKLNRENPLVEHFINYYWSILDSETNKITAKKEKVVILE